MKKELIKEIKKMHGFVLGIGLEEEMQDAIYENDAIYTCDLIENMNRGTSSSLKGKSKSISIYKLKKTYKKKKPEFIICNIEDIDIYMKYLLRDGTYIVKQKIYLYGILKKEQQEDLLVRLKRYDFLITKKQKKEDCLFILEKKSCHYLKNEIYFLLDSFSMVLDKASALLER